jgi:hypothetical protein
MDDAVDSVSSLKPDSELKAGLQSLVTDDA